MFGTISKIDMEINIEHSFANLPCEINRRFNAKHYFTGGIKKVNTVQMKLLNLNDCGIRLRLRLRLRKK